MWGTKGLNSELGVGPYFRFVVGFSKASVLERAFKPQPLET